MPDRNPTVSYSFSAQLFNYSLVSKLFSYSLSTLDGQFFLVGLNLVSFPLTANKFGLMYSRKRISQNSFPNFIYIFPKSFMMFCQELLDPKRNYENQI